MTHQNTFRGTHGIGTELSPQSFQLTIFFQFSAPGSSFIYVIVDSHALNWNKLVNWNNMEEWFVPFRGFTCTSIF